MAFNFGDRLIEIAALTTIIGATTVESLALGSRGAGGLPWAAMSSFGCFYLIKACIAAAMPSWLRESFGVNSFLSCSILGLSYPLHERSMLRVPSGSPVGISVKVNHGEKDVPAHTGLCLNSVHVFDEHTCGIIQSCPSFPNSGRPQRFTCTKGQPPGETRDWIAIVGTLVKLIETLVLWVHASWQLSVAATGSWAFFFLAAIALQSLGLSRESKGCSSSARSSDIIAGELPTIYGRRKTPKIIFGAPSNIRTHRAWLFVWVVGGLVAVSATVATHLILEKATAKQFYLWMSFQCLWLFARILFYHFAVATDGRRHVVDEKGPPDEKGRLLVLSSGVSRQLAQLHPRRPQSYQQDVHELVDIQPRLASAISSFAWSGICVEEKSLHYGPDLYRPGDCVNLDILAVVGDTALSSLSWIHGCDISSAHLYDSCLVVVKIGSETYLIPSARVLSGTATQMTQNRDVEAGTPPRFIPKYDPGRVKDSGWVFWIPVGLGKWLYVVCSLDFLGKQQAMVLDSEEVSRRLMLGTLGVSLRSVEEIKEQVESAAIVARILLFYLDLEEDHDGFVRVARPRFPP